MVQTKLPVTNESGYYEIRLESIGGLGANLCGKVLGEMGIKYLALNSASFSSYGSEKTGTPVKSYIRFCDMAQEIRVHSPVTNPHVLAVFHEALLERDRRKVLEGCYADSKIILNTPLNPQAVAERYQIPISMLSCVPAQKIAMESKSRINMVMLGAIGRVMGFVPLEALQRICHDALGKKYPDALEANLEGVRRGYEEVLSAESVNMGYLDAESQAAPSEYSGADSTGVRAGVSGSEVFPVLAQRTSWGYKTAPIGGINPRFGSTVSNDLSPSRQGYIPVFLKERCINCGLCDTTCPDMVFQFREGEYKGKRMMLNQGLDYYHCKGCLRCVDVCPSGALVKGLESDYPRKSYFMPNQDLLRKPDYYEQTGTDGYITSESFLTEERVEGGEV